MVLKFTNTETSVPEHLPDTHCLYGLNSEISVPETLGNIGPVFLFQAIKSIKKLSEMTFLL